MVYKEIYFIGGENGKADADDFIIRYLAENGAKINIFYPGKGAMSCMFLGETFDTIKAAMNACDNHKLKIEEWEAIHPTESYRTVWAADTNAGFGKKGDSVYGTSPSTYIVRDERIDDYNHVLHLWNSALGALPEEA